MMIFVSGFLLVHTISSLVRSPEILNIFWGLFCHPPPEAAVLIEFFPLKAAYIPRPLSFNILWPKMVIVGEIHSFICEHGV